MSEGTFSRRAALAAVAATAAAVRSTAGAAQGKERTPQEQQNLQLILDWWKEWRGDPPSVEAITSKFADDCLMRVGDHSELVAQGKRAVSLLITAIALSDKAKRFAIDVPETFVSGPMVVTEFNSASWKQGEAPRSAPQTPRNRYVGMFVVKQGKISMWIDMNRNIDVFEAPMKE